MPDEDVTPEAPPPPLKRQRVDARGELPPGTQVGDYVVLGTLASGGFGAVQSAEHRVLKRRVALKVLHPELATSEEIVQRFIREAQVVNRIRHPNIVDIHDFGTLPDGRPYFVMELLPGASLRALLDQRGRIGLREAIAILRPVASALEAAHAEGVVHRDLKASNVMVVREGDPPLVKLLDFGIAKLISPDASSPGLTMAGQRLGTPHSMSPEQIRGGHVDALADVYGFGVLVFQTLTGSYPFDAPDPLELERMHLEMPPPRPSSRAPLPKEVDAVVLRAMEKDPARRQPSTTAVVTELEIAAGLRGERRAGPQKRVGAAIYAQARLDARSAEDEEVLAALGELLSNVEAELVAAGFRPVLQTASTMLAVRLLDARLETARLQRRAALALARELAAKAASQPRVRLELSLHTGAVEVEQGLEGPEASGGPLLDPGAWPPGRLEGGVLTTPDAVQGLDSSNTDG